MNNKKIKNAHPYEYNNIKFKSQLEVMIYKTLSQVGFNVCYEPTKYTVWRGFRPTIPFYTKDKKTNTLKLEDKKLIDITYTPDFIIKTDNITIVIEAKGYCNDLYPYKKKLFREYLECIKISKGENTLFFEIYTKKQLMQAINIIYEYIRRNKEKDNLSS